LTCPLCCGAGEIPLHGLPAERPNVRIDIDLSPLAALGDAWRRLVGVLGVLLERGMGLVTVEKTVVEAPIPEPKCTAEIRALVMADWAIEKVEDLVSYLDSNPGQIPAAQIGDIRARLHDVVSGVQIKDQERLPIFVPGRLEEANA